MKFRHLSLGLMVLAMQAPSIAAPVVNSSAYFTDRRAPNTATAIPSGLREQTQWSLNISTAGACSDVSVVVSRAGNASFNLIQNVDPIFANCDFSRLSNVFGTTASMLAFAGQTNPWSYTVTDSSGSVSGLFPLIAEAEAIPFAQNVLISDAGATPTLSWTLPDLTGFDVDRIRVRAVETDTGLIVFQAALAANATSYTFNPGVLQFGHTYFYRVMLEDLENGLQENRSNAFSAVSTRVPEPGTWALMAIALTALAGVGRQRSSRAKLAQAG